LQVIEVKQETGFTIPELSERTRRPPCSGCGLSKRYLMNRAALEGGFPVLATGHNLDDVAAILFGNVLHWQTEQLSRMTPVRPATHAKLAKTVKPLIRVTEREAVAYCLLRGVDYHEDECPNAVGATLLLYKDVINQIEAVSPGSKQAFYQEFVKKIQPHLAAGETVTLRECDVCGQVTTGEVCAYCRMMERARQTTVRRGRVTRTVLEVPPA
ncbi:MAG TPA: tRNA(Ile)-lysidine synthetase, partial [Candidatus Methylomirabilis sp.]|nr:tRNA(Ile)-lysidine synthetase [Candidatus Methylomirabilis sp.]